MALTMGSTEVVVAEHMVWDSLWCFPTPKFVVCTRQMKIFSRGMTKILQNVLLVIIGACTEYMALPMGSTQVAVAEHMVRGSS